MMEEISAEDIRTFNINEIKHKIQWSDKENGFINREKWRRPELISKHIKLSYVLNFRLLKSCFSSFLKEYNLRKGQNKEVNLNKFLIEEWDYVTDEDIRKEWDDHNDFLDGPWLMLNDLVLDEDEIDLGKLREKIFVMRLNDQQIEVMDEGLKYFKKLVIVYMPGNFLKSVPGDFLPKSVKYLELFGNSLESIRSLGRNRRLKLYHLGLGRNRLTNNSDFHLLATRESFQFLHSLDLMDNDITDLLSVVEPLRGLRELRSLSLEGCPCSTCYHYKEGVLSNLPNLIYLDYTKILEEDRVKDEGENEYDYNNGAFLFTCYRIFGLPPPPKDKKVDHFFYFEIKLPLLQEFYSISDDSSVRLELPTPIPSDIELLKETTRSKTDVKSNKSKSTKKPPGFYDRPNEYDEEREKYTKIFRTERVHHTKNMTFTEPTLVVNAPECDLTALRDTFRTKVLVKFVYIQVEKKTGKDKKKGKKNDGKKKADKEKPKSPEEKSEVILKKMTLAKFKCNLQSCNWSDEYVDYYWADTPEITTHALPMTGSLKAIQYSDKKAKKPKKKQDDEPEVLTYKVPKIFTIQIGFGLKRNKMEYPVKEEKKRKGT